MTETFDPQGFMEYERTETHGAVSLEFDVPEGARGSLTEIFEIVAALRRAVNEAQTDIEAAGGRMVFSAHMNADVRPVGVRHTVSGELWRIVDDA